MNYIEDLREQIQEYRELGEGEGYETNVTAIANALLELGGKTRINGYIVKDECIMKAIRKDVVAVYQRIRADKVVLKRRERPVRNSLLSSELPVLVIECKHYSSDCEFEDDDLKQIQDYMTAIEFKHGILLSEYRAEFFSFSRNRDRMVISRDIDKSSSDIVHDIERIIGDIKSF